MTIKKQTDIALLVGAIQGRVDHLLWIIAQHNAGQERTTKHLLEIRNDINKIWKEIHSETPTT